MKKLILATLLTLLSFNANARCFDNDAKDDYYFSCTVAEGLGYGADKSLSFLSFKLGFVHGLIWAKMKYSTDYYAQTLTFDSIYKCSHASLNILEKIIEDKLKVAEISFSDDYWGTINTVYNERAMNCIKRELEKSN